MAAAVGNDWDSQDLECCAPKVFVKQCRGQKILKSQIHSMVKMDCTYSSCNQSGFMHYECLNELEDQLKRAKQDAENQAAVKDGESALNKRVTELT